MRRRVLIASFLGLATQWSGNGLTSYVLITSHFWIFIRSRCRYFLSKILDNVGVTDNHLKNQINLALTCWGFVNATALALTVPRMKRRTAYLVCPRSGARDVKSLMHDCRPVPCLCCSSSPGGQSQAHALPLMETSTRQERLLREYFNLAARIHSDHRSKTALSSCTALRTTSVTMRLPTVSTSRHTHRSELLTPFGSLPCRVVPLPRSCQGYCHLPVVGTLCWFLQPVRQPYRNQECRYDTSHFFHEENSLVPVRLEILHQLRCLPRLRGRLCVFPVPRDLWALARRTRLPYVELCCHAYLCVANSRAVYEDNIQATQKKRVEQELNEDPTPISPGSRSMDKEENDAYHLENTRKS